MSNCQYKFLKGNKRNSLCGIKVRNNSKYCYKHKKLMENTNQSDSIEDIKNDPIFNEEMAIKKLPKKTKKSKFLISVISNKVYKNMPHDDRIKFKSVIQHIFNKNQIFSENLLCPKKPILLPYQK